MNSLRIILKNRQYQALAIMFATFNVLLGTWAIYIPHVKSKLKIGDGQFGTAMLFFGLGTFLMLLVAPSIIKKIRLGRASYFGLMLLILVFILPLVVNSFYGLCASLFLAGLISGLADISMNSLVSEVENRNGDHIMTAIHGFFSLGGMISAGIGTFFIPIVEVPAYHMLVVVILMIIVNAFFVKEYFSFVSEPAEKSRFTFQDVKPIIMLILVGFFIMGSEGAIEHWSALYLENVTKVDEKFIGLGFTAFSFTMALFRFFGDKVSLKYGSHKIILIGILIAMIGFLAVLMTNFIMVLVGFALTGVGFSVIIPELYRIGGKLPGIDAAKGISMIAGAGFLGFLLFPFLLGKIAEASSLKMSFAALLFFSFVSFVLMLISRRK